MGSGDSLRAVEGRERWKGITFIATSSVKAQKAGSSKLRSKFETLRREIKADVRKQHDLNVNIEDLT